MAGPIPPPSSLRLPTTLLGWVLLIPAVVLFVGFVVGVPLNLYWLYRTTRSDPVPIEAVPEGEVVEIQGTVEPLPTAPTAVMSGDPAGAYEYEVRVEKTFAGPRSTDDGWRHLDEGRAVHPFLVDDGTGLALVDPEHADVQFDSKIRGYVSADERPPTPIEDRLDVGGDPPWDPDAPVGEFTDMGLLDRSVEYTERSLTAGDTVYVRGPATDVRELSGSDRVDREPTVGIGGEGNLGVLGSIGAKIPTRPGDNVGARFAIAAGGQSRAVRKYVLRVVVSAVSVVLFLGAGYYFLWTG